MNCSRSGCGCAMAQNYVTNIGYICAYCRSDFKDHMERTFGAEEQKESVIFEELEKFMKSTKGFSSVEQMSVDEFFGKHG